MLSALPLENLRERVKLFEGAGAVHPRRPPSPAGAGARRAGSKQVTTSSGVVVTLTANQLRECERTGAKPEVFAEQLARRTVKA
jgi:hypothetical protein